MTTEIKTFSQLNKIKNHIENKTFGLKDFEKTKSKRENYKPEKVNDFFKLYDEDLNNFIENELSERLICCLNNNFNSDIFKILTKSNINYCSTFINNKCFDENKSFIKDIFPEDSNENELREFTILFYLNYYDKINEVMKEVFKNYYFNSFEILGINTNDELKKYLILQSLKGEQKIK